MPFWPFTPAVWFSPVQSPQKSFCHLFRSQLQFQIHSRHRSHSANSYRSQLQVTVSDTLQTRKSLCYSYKSQLQIQSRYAPDTVAILSLIQNLFPARSCSTHRFFSVTNSEYRYTPDTKVILIFIQESNTVTARIRSRHRRHPLAHTNPNSIYNSDTFQIWIPFWCLFYWFSTNNFGWHL